MPAFDYAALDARGRSRSGVISADSAEQARSALERRRLLPLRLQPAAVSSQPRRGPGGFGARRRAMFTRQLASLAASAPLEEALRMIGAQSDHAATRQVVMAVHGLVVEGLRLADAMARQGKAFPPLYRAMVAAGERSGALPDVLERLAELLERQQEVRSRLATALVYPAALALTAMAVVLALMIAVVPKVVEQFDSLGRELPWLTGAVIALSDLLVGYGLVLLAALVLAGLAFARGLRRPGFRLAVDRTVLRLPLVGRLLRDMHAARMARTLGIMLNAGVPLVEGLEMTARTVGNRVLRMATADMAVAIDEGGSLSGAMRRAGILPPTLLYMVGSGEASGHVAPMLERAADYLEREFNTTTTAAMSLLEPAIIIVLGGVVALIVLSILLPILQFNSLAAG